MNTPFNELISEFEAIRDELQSLAYDSDGWLDPEDLMGCCAIGTVWTADFLKSQNFAVQIAHNDYHFWLRCEGYVIDLTATQFGHINPILIQPITIETEYHWYEKPIVLENLTAEYFQQIKWPDEQNPFYYETEKQID